MKPRVPRDWVGETVFLIAGGPSVDTVDLNRLRGHRVVVVNSSYITYNKADALVFTDRRWWTKHRRRVQATFGGEVVTLTPHHKELYDGLSVYDRQRSGGISNDPTRLAWWHTTMTTALNWVALKGAARIGVLGLDGKDAPDGRSWHHEPHPARWGRYPHRYEMHGKALEATVAPLCAIGVEVFNLNPNSAHKMFEFASLEDVLMVSEVSTFYSNEEVLA